MSYRLNVCLAVGESNQTSAARCFPRWPDARLHTKYLIDPRPDLIATCYHQCSGRHPALSLGVCRGQPRASIPRRPRMNVIHHAGAQDPAGMGGGGSPGFPRFRKLYPIPTDEKLKVCIRWNPSMRVSALFSVERNVITVCQYRMANIRLCTFLHGEIHFSRCQLSS